MFLEASTVDWQHFLTILKKRCRAPLSSSWKKSAHFIVVYTSVLKKLVCDSVDLTARGILC